jgi:hypothetical protein
LVDISRFEIFAIFRVLRKNVVSGGVRYQAVKDGMAQKNGPPWKRTRQYPFFCGHWTKRIFVNKEKKILSYFLTESRVRSWILSLENDGNLYA